MAGEKYVPLDVYFTTTRVLLTLIHELGVAMQVNRAALMNADAKSLPLRADYLKGLDADIRKHPRIRASLAGC